MRRPFRRPAALLAAPLLAAALLAAPAAAQNDPDQRPQLSKADEAAVERVEDYLEGVDTMHAQFLQTSSNGTTARGEVWLHRPGKLRFEYDDPNPYMLVSNGTLLLYWDRELDQTSYVPISETPLWFLLEDEIDVSAADGYRIARVSQDKATLELQIVQEGSWVNEPGSVALIFQDDPLRLKKWRIVDQQGVATEVALLEPRFGVQVDPDLFDFGELDLPSQFQQQNNR